MTKVNALKIIDEAKLNINHKILVFWCAVVMLFDGYDLVIYGSVLPHLMKEWALSPQTAGLLGAASLMGMMIGAVTLGMAADKFGRKNIIIACTILSSCAVAATGFANTTESFFLCRLLTGVGLGGAVPNLVTIIKEMAPTTHRNRLINFMLAFYGVGAILSGLAGLFIIPNFGWEASFWVAGTCIILIPLMYKTFPESIGYLVNKDKQTEVIKTLKLFNPEFKHSPNNVYVVEHSNSNKAPIVELFTEGKALKTFYIWVGFAMVMLMVYGLNAWLPKLMNVGGYSLGSSITFLVTLNIGAIVGTLIFGVIADKWGTTKTLILGYLLASISISFLGFHPPTWLLNLLLIIAGGATVGTMSVIHTLAADFYPTKIRSTGVSFAAAMGRFGAISGPLFGGFLLAMSLPFEQNFILFALPGLVGILVITLFSIKNRSSVVHQLTKGKSI